LFGRGVRVVARASGTGPAVLQQRVGAGAWRDLRAVRHGATVVVRPRATTQYRLSVAGVSGPELAVAVAPRLRVRPLGAALLGGTILPRPSGAVTVWRFEPGGWRLVARPRLDASGAFRTPLRLRPGGYRVVVAGDGRLAAAEARVRV